MAVYIDKDEIKRELINRAEELEQVESFDALLRSAAIYMSLLCLELAKPKDVAPVIHAHWIKDDNEQCYCSACMDDHHRPMFFTPHPQWRYCPWCGAKMDEVI